MLDNRSPLMKRLAEIMPKKPEQPKYNSQHFCIEVEPIRKATDSFVSWMNDDLPANKEELYAMLLAFGKITSGYMEFMLRHSMRISDDLLATLPINPTIIHLSEIGEVTEDQMKAMSDAPSNPTLKFDHVSLDLTDEEITKMKGLRGEFVGHGLYEWTEGKALKDCKKETV